MAGPYIRRQSWPAFVHDGTEYPLTHLDEMYLDAPDNTGLLRRIAITFEDHCFTRVPDLTDPTLVYPGCSRNPGYFCFERYQASLQLPTLLQSLPSLKVWNVNGEAKAYLPLIDFAETERIYHVIFGLRRVRGLPVDLHLRVETAYLGDCMLATFGTVRFSTLVDFALAGKRVKENFDRNRPKPRTY